MGTRAAWQGVLGLWLGLCLGVAPAAERHEAIAVIAHPDFIAATLGVAELASIFRREELVDARGGPLVPVNLPGRDPLRLALSRALFDQTPSDMEAYWNERYFHGVAPPHVVASVEAMLRFVAATSGAIGYVPLCAVDARVKVIARLPAPPGLPAMDCAVSSESIPNLQTEIAR